ncbi:MAG: hypothetical protein LBB45_04555 [Methanobrevibacter sp.]|jgi:asparagine N-glycosylation enzyme membrane subunit Stt3|nr:hypothetical protein [Candidatus Methanovirga basalitermitum]
MYKKKLISLLIIGVMVASTVSSSFADFSVSDTFGDNGTFTWEDHSDSAVNKYIYGGYGLGYWDKLGSLDGRNKLILNNWKAWFKNHDYAYARFYYEIILLSETAATQKYLINQNDNVTLKTNSDGGRAWIELWVNGVRLEKVWA